MKKFAKPKKIQFSLIDPNRSPQHEAYRLLGEMRSRNHQDITGARVALAWRKAWKKDKDGHLILGRCMKASDLQRELVDWDFVILLNKEMWELPEFGKEKKLALLDHELCHAGIALDKDLAPIIDEKGRNVWRIRKHDIEEFREVVQRHGLYKRDLEEFAKACLKKQSAPLFAEEPARHVETTVSMTDGDGNVIMPPTPLDAFSKAAKRMSKEH